MPEATMGHGLALNPLRKKKTRAACLMGHLGAQGDDAAVMLGILLIRNGTMWKSEVEKKKIPSNLSRNSQSMHIMVLSVVGITP